MIYQYIPQHEALMLPTQSDICYTMGMSGLPDMYTRSPRVPRASGVHIRQTTNAHGITVMYHIPTPLANWNQLKPGSIQVCNPIVFIGKVVGIDCGFSLT